TEDRDGDGGVAQGDATGRVQADDVAGQYVGVGALDAHAMPQVPGDEIPLGAVVDAVAVGADDVIDGSRARDPDSRVALPRVRRVANGDRAGPVRPDVVPLDHVVGRRASAAVDLHAALEVAADDIARRHALAADHVVRRPGLDADPVAQVAQG